MLVVRPFPLLVLRYPAESDRLGYRQESERSRPKPLFKLSARKLKLILQNVMLGQEELYPTWKYRVVAVQKLTAEYKSNMLKVFFTVYLCRSAPEQCIMTSQVYWCKTDYTFLCSGEDILSVMMLDSGWLLTVHLYSSLLQLNAARLWTMKPSHSKNPTIMTSIRRKPATPHVARQRRFCQKKKKT